MLNRLVHFILRNRILLLVLIGLGTAFMAYKAQKVQLSYEFMQMLPQSDSTLKSYKKFKSQFGEDGSVLVIGVTNSKMFEYNQFCAWYDVGNQLRKLKGVEEVVSITRAVTLVKNDSLQKFQILPLVGKRPRSQSQVDSIKQQLHSMPFYNGLIYNPKNNSYLMAVTLNKQILNDKSRQDLVLSIKKTVDNYAAKQHLQAHYSGLPYIRTATTLKVKHELNLFVILSLLIAATILIAFFRSGKVVAVSLLIVAISLITLFGVLSLFDYRITMLTGVIPSLLTIIAIENCIYFINKYHWEYCIYKNKIRALSLVIKRIGFASFITNATTASGFATFIFIDNEALSQFGAVASICIMIEYFLCLILIPILFSMIAPPEQRHTKHINSKRNNFLLAHIRNIILNHRKKLYISIALFLCICIWGISLLKTSGKIVDDIPEKDPIYVDLKYFEHNFHGVMPFEISIDTKHHNRVMKLSTIRRIEQLQEVFKRYPEFSRPLSIVELVKFSKQAYYNGNEKYYALPDEFEKAFILSYLPQNTSSQTPLLRSFIDSTKQTTRISIQMADVGSKRMNELVSRIRLAIDSIFPPQDYIVQLTGNSIVFTQGTGFLINNLLESIFLGIIFISILMAILFTSYRMVIIAMIVNIIPLIITAAVMGYSGIPVKPSTLIVFCVSLGIAVDNAIQFLSRYRFELRTHHASISQAVIVAINEMGISMIYSSLVLVAGFGIFLISSFGGINALGILIAITLFFALFFDVLFLPSLLLSLERFATTKTFRKPLVELYDEDDEPSTKN